MAVNNVEYLDSLVSKYGNRVFAKYNKNIDEDNVYIGRNYKNPNILGNPFKTPNDKSLSSRISNCIKFRNYLSGEIKKGNQDLIQAVKDLKGKNVVCFCSNGTTSTEDGARYCHGHILLSACDYLHNKEG